MNKCTLWTYNNSNFKILRATLIDITDMRKTQSKKEFPPSLLLTCKNWRYN